MGRLIDADALKDRLKRNSIFEKITDAAGMNVHEIIDERPTAYDVEKVVAELEKLTIDCEVGQIYNGMYIRRKDAIDIVRAGGQEDYDKIIRNKAIDEFAERICVYGTYDDFGNKIDVLEIAEQLKKAGAT